MDKMNQPIDAYTEGNGYSNNMDCKCARKNDVLKCDQQGSYKEFQAFEDMKYCVDRDGFRTTIQYFVNDGSDNCRIPQCEPSLQDLDPDSCRDPPDCEGSGCNECKPCEETTCN